MVDIMSLWLVRAGRNGEQEQAALNYGVAAIGWNDLPDLSKIKSREDLKKLYEETYPGSKKGTINNEVGQIWTFIHRIEKKDLIALPSKFSSSIAIGEVTGSYTYRTDLDPNIKHTLQVKWLKTDIPRTVFDQDLLYSLGAFMTVCKIERNKAEERVRAIVGGTYQKDDDDHSDEIIDVEQAAQDQIMDYLNRKFKGHELTRLVEAVLQAEGYVTTKSEPGPDGGVDILAGSGAMGFDNPRICVQVKSSQSPIDVTVLRNLQGILKNFGADQGLLVSWGGFNKAVLEEARRNFFTIRLWDSSTLLQAITRNYDRLPDTLQAELPLKRVWALVVEED
jgi:restriction system protein